MLSYRHEFHAGNIGDLIKHAVLTLIIEYLKQKPAPIRYIDTHAGAGLYSTSSAMARKLDEYQQGVGSLSAENFSPELAAYYSVIAAFAELKKYPGSPLLAAKLFRTQDELHLFELHSTEYPLLQELFARDRRVHVANTDGFASAKALLPVSNARALVLIDPSYELQSDYEAVVTCIEQGYARMPHAIFAIWYPAVDEQSLSRMIRKLHNITQQKFWRFELTASNTANEKGLKTTGMLVINPPWTLPAALDVAFERICQRLPFDVAKYSGLCLKQ